MKCLFSFCSAILILSTSVPVPQQRCIDESVKGAKEKNLFMKSVNALMAWQELPRQQVMSYIVGGGDHYKSHSFVVVSCDHLSEYM